MSDLNTKAFGFVRPRERLWAATLLAFGKNRGKVPEGFFIDQIFKLIKI
jgi:hypothetical protein